jgi:hypothetical protein
MNNDDIEGGVTAQVILPVSLLHRGVAPLPGSSPRSNAAGFEQQSAGQSEQSGVGVIAGVPKWTPGMDVSPFPQVVRTPDDDPLAEHLVERTSTDGLFTATIAGTTVSLPEGVEPIDYSYPPAAERTPLPRKPPAQPKPKPVAPEPITERLPIYEDVLSRWFQGGEVVEPPGKGETTMERFAAEQAQQTPETPAQRTSSPKLPKRQERETPSSRRAAKADWGVGDEGWQQANAVLKSSVADKTTAGLPKRVPNARLIPGSPATQSAPVQTGQNGQSAAVATVAPPRRRSAEKLRQQFATYQRGVQMGRQSLDDIESWDSPLFGSSTPGDKSAEKEQR